MRNWLALLLMLLLPLQWSTALAADCCAHEDAAGRQMLHTAMSSGAMQHAHHHDAHQSANEHHAQGGHAEHAAFCDGSQDCAGCHVHHCTAALPIAGTLALVLARVDGSTPYAQHLTSPAPDGLFRPPLLPLA